MYYCVENSREYQEVGPQFMDVDSDTAPAIVEGMNSLGAKMTSYYRCMMAKSISIVSTSSANPLTLKCQYFL